MKMTDDELKEYKKSERERQRQRWELKRALQREEEELDNRFDRFKPRLREVSSALREILQDVLDEADVRRYEEDPTPDLGRVHDHIEAAIRTLDYYRLLLDNPACLEQPIKCECDFIGCQCDGKCTKEALDEGFYPVARTHTEAKSRECWMLCLRCAVHGRRSGFLRRKVRRA